MSMLCSVARQRQGPRAVPVEAAARGALLDNARLARPGRVVSRRTEHASGAWLLAKAVRVIVTLVGFPMSFPIHSAPPSQAEWLLRTGIGIGQFQLSCGLSCLSCLSCAVLPVPSAVLWAPQPRNGR